MRRDLSCDNRNRLGAWPALLRRCQTGQGVFFGSVLICLRWVRRCRGARRCRSTAATKSGHYQRRSSFDRDTIQLVSIQIEMHSAVTISLIPEARGAPFVFRDDLAAGCEKAAALGFDAVEVFPRSAQELDVQQLKKLLAQHGLGLAAVGTGAGRVVHKLSLTDPDAETRRCAQEFAAAIVEVAGGLGAPAIIGSMQGCWEGGLTRDQALGWLAEAIEELARRAQNHGASLLVESLNRYETNLLTNVADSLDLLKKLRAHNVKLLCDLFHMNIEEASIADALRRAGPQLGHLHFVDSNRRAVGFGHTDIAPVVQALRDIGYAGYVSGEVLPLPDSETAAKQTVESFKKWFR